ncbi:MAG: DUF1801 domain-containing protein [Saprospiraceae bacterium]
MSRLNREVTIFLDELDHPFRSEIELLRVLILNAVSELTENIKWNGPNYCVNDADRITMKIQPPRQIQLIFHRGAKKLEQPKDRLIDTNSGILIWKENDRAIASFKNKAEIENNSTDLSKIVQDWVQAAQ